MASFEELEGIDGGPPPAPPPPPPGYIPKAIQTHRPVSSALTGGKANNTHTTSSSPTVRPWQYRKREAHGHSGLFNQGATCYLNSLIQTLYNCAEFRRSLYAWEYDEKTGPSNVDRCIPYQLQLLFANLQISGRGAVNTTGLTRAFGWTSGQQFHQHDITELMLVLFDALDRTIMMRRVKESAKLSKEEKEKYLNAPTFINELFQGEMSYQTHCNACKNVSERIEKIMDIPLTLASHQGELYHSLEEAWKIEFIEEKFEGENQYKCSQCDKRVDAVRSFHVHRLPPILPISLRRFTFSYETFQRVKLVHFVEFPQTLNLSKLLNPKKKVFAVYSGGKKEPIKHPVKYELFSILMHSGSAHGGHYYMFALSPKDKKWYRFDDASVTPMEDSDFWSAYGGKPNTKPASSDIKSKEKSMSSTSSNQDISPSAAVDPDSVGGDASSMSSPPPPPAGAAPKSVKEMAVSSEKKPSPASSYASGASAYMLFYRREDVDNDEVEDDLIPSYIRQHVAEELKKFKAERKAWKKKQNTWSLQIHFRNDAFVVPMYNKMTLSDVLKQAHKQLMEGKVLNPENEKDHIDRFRLCSYYGSCNLPGHAYTTEMKKSLRDLHFAKQKDLFLEQMPPEADTFDTKAEDHVIFLHMHIPTQARFSEAIPVYLDVKKPLTHLQEQAKFALTQAQVLKASIPASSLAFYRVLTTDFSATRIDQGIESVPVSKKEGKEDAEASKALVRPISEMGVVEGCTLHVENLACPGVPELVESMQFFIDITYNDPKDAGLLNAPLLEISFDRRRTIAELKAVLGEYIHMPVDKFRMCTSALATKEYKHGSYSLFDAGLYSGSRVHLRRGTPLGADDVKVKAFMYNDTRGAAILGLETDKNQEAEKEATTPSTPTSNLEKKKVQVQKRKRRAPFKYLCEIPLNKQATFGEAKDLILEHLQLNGPDYASRLRLRTKVGFKMTTVHRESETIQAKFPRLLSGIQIAVQVLEEPEKLSEDDLVVVLQQFLPKDWTLADQRQEIVVQRGQRYGSLREKLSALVKIPVEHLRLCKRPLINDPAVVASAQWDCDDRMVITASPWYVVDGTCLLFKDDRHPNKFDVEENTSVGRGTGTEHSVVIDVYADEAQQSLRNMTEEEMIALALQLSSEEASAQAKNTKETGPVVHVVEDEKLEKDQDGSVQDK